MTRYEYKEVVVYTTQDPVEMLNELGAQGWHLVHTYDLNNRRFLMERPLEIEITHLAAARETAME